MEYHDQLDRARENGVDVPRMLIRPKTDISADARYIVKHLWIIFIILPFVLGVVLYVLK